MDELKHRAGEKLEAFHVAAVTAAGNGRSRVQDVYNNTSEGIQKIREIFNELWHNELIAEGRARVAAWVRETAQRVRDGAPPLSPMQLYEDLRAMFNDRVWRRSVVIFACGCVVGGGCGLALGLRAAAHVPRGPHARALHTQPDQSVIYVDDAVTAGAGADEVLVRVQAFSACECDRRVLRGRGHTLRMLLHHQHLTLGRGFAGVVLDVGPGVRDLELGDEVWGYVSEWSGGAATELLTIRRSRVSRRPARAGAGGAGGAEGAAALAGRGARALRALQDLRCTPDNCKGKRVAICGAASGEGCVLIQLLSGWGAHLTVCAPRHAAPTLQELGAHEYVDIEKTKDDLPSEWAALETNAKLRGPWDALVTCAAANVPPAAKCNTAALLKATARRGGGGGALDLRARALLSDRLPAPLVLLYAAAFYTYRLLRWVVGYGSHTDWLEDKYTMREGLEILTQLVDSGHLKPIVDKVYYPQDFENALAHACSEDAIGTTVIRFP